MDELNKLAQWQHGDELLTVLGIVDGFCLSVSWVEEQKRAILAIEHLNNVALKFGWLF